MKYMLFSLALAAVLLALPNCRKDSCQHQAPDCQQTCPVESLEQAEQRLPGEWEWVLSYTRDRGGEQVETPLVTSKRILHRYADGRLHIFENDSLTRELRYELEFDNQLHIRHFDLISNELVIQLQMHLSREGACFTTTNPNISIENREEFRRK
jgi:hypothetical protein